MAKQSARTTNEGEVYVLQHNYSVNGCDETKLIGVYGSQQAAEEASARLREMPGFKQRASGFQLDRYVLNVDHWAEGFRGD